MGRYSSSSNIIMCLPSLMVALALMTGLAEAQSGDNNTPACAEDLIPCVNYLQNSTTPPSSCCNPLKQAVANQLTCLCNLFNTPGLLQNFNVTVNDALQLSRRCGVTTDISRCKSGAPSPASGAPPATPGGGDKGAAGRVSFTGLSFLLLAWASILFN